MDRGKATDACANYDDTKGEGSMVTTVGGGSTTPMGMSETISAGLLG